MAKKSELNRRLSAFGLSSKDLSKAELIKAKADLEGGTGGFLSSEELISKAFRRKCKH